MATKKRRARKNIFLRLSVLCFVCYIAVVLVRLQTEISQNRKLLDALNESCKEQSIANKEVERMVQMGDDDEYIERVVRAKSGYAYPDERVFYPITGKL